MYKNMHFDKVLVLGVSTNQNAGLVNWKTSLSRLGYDYRVIGLGEPWKGFIETRVRLMREAVKGVSPTTLVMCVDTNDVLFRRPPEDALRVANAHAEGESLLLLGTDLGGVPLMKRMPSYANVRSVVKKQKHTYRIADSKFKPVTFGRQWREINGGSICGDALSLAKGMDFILAEHKVNPERWKNDDQAAWLSYAATNPFDVTLDVNDSMFHCKCTADQLLAPQLYHADSPTAVMTHFVGMRFNPVLTRGYNKLANVLCGNEAVECVWTGHANRESKMVRTGAIMLCLLGVGVAIVLVAKASSRRTHHSKFL